MTTQTLQATPETTEPRARTYDAIGVGFGPSNLALAAALHETLPPSMDFSYRFLEKNPSFVWHGNMLLDNSRMQISFMKDLVTLRNPMSRYSFINYLKQKGRLQDFINLGTFYPSRHEFNDYLSWVATHFNAYCDYGEEVVAIEPERSQGQVALLRVRSRSSDGRENDRLARNVVIGVGGTPNIPDAFRSCRGHPRVFHSSRYLQAMAPLGAPERVAIVGSGQSAAEIFLDLHDRQPAARIDLISRAPALKPADSSPFVNQIFNTDYTDYVYRRPACNRQHLQSQFRNTNYSVVDLELIETIFDVMYQQKVTATQRHGILFRSHVGHVAADRHGIRLDIVCLDGGERTTRCYDVVVLATGYRRHHHKELLKPLRPYLIEDQVNRDYRVGTTPDCQPAIFLQGCCEATHGLSDTLLSVLPVRAQEIIDAMV